ncbi:hypothetical protein ATE92_2570 [Ulvibacter sp. MAR_2010_11]|uniref:hypothetical protein n=1 Tax=Ulvibacter sp. MAR_2010_11 TaxID=1250229 RepID=UPI000CB15ACB|nr:hypothetical protein [Ulvibacter sp. MAR_2010_11]PKA84382.1 hypothetical protein ATE92_2570 [Ulvibacter sp. MAR_2010_11]
MRNKSVFKDLFAFIPLLISGLLCIGLIFLLWQKVSSTPTFTETLTQLTTIFIGISGFLSAVIMVYLAVAAMNLKNTKANVVDNLGKFTQKMHTFRSIVELLFRSKIWLPGLKEYIDDEFAGLTFFEVKEFYKGKSKLAIEFLQENHNYADTENLYLEMKSLLLTGPKEKNVPEDIAFPKMYSKDIVAKWLEHKCGSGLWYYFGYKYAVFKEALDLNAVFERHQDKIMSLANTIDSEAFEDSSFNEIFLSKLGEYMTKEVIPQLYQFQDESNRKMPGFFRYMYGLFLFLVLFGVLLPIFFLLFNLSILTLIVSFAFVISVIFFITISFYPFLSKEING